MKKTFVVLFLTTLILSACQTKEVKDQVQNLETDSTLTQEESNGTKETTEEKKPEDKLCGWIDGMSVIIKINLPEGYKESSAFESGIEFYSETNGEKARLARIARQACDYRVGFEEAELQGIKQGIVAVWGFDDNQRKEIVDSPVTLTFTDGVPDQGKIVEVTLK